MRRTIIISAFLFFLLPSLKAEDTLEISYGMLKRSRFIETLISRDGISYKMTVRQDFEGRLGIESPPFLVADINDTLKIGELQDNRILSAMLVPYSDVDLFDGFVRGKNLKDIEKLSKDPSMSGIAVTLEHLDIISLNPMFNPESPSGSGVIAGNSNAFAGILYAGRNEIVLKDGISSYQVDWRRTGFGRSMIFWIVGAADKTVFHGIEIESSAFVQSSWDRLLGGGTTTVWRLSAEGTKFGLNASRGLGGIGPWLKSLGETRSPMEELGTGAVFKDSSISLEARYISSTFDKPVYGGRSQVRKIELRTSVRIGKLKIEANHSTSFERDFAKVQKTEYRITADAADVKLEMNLDLNREVVRQPSLSGFSVQMDLRHGKLRIKENKTQLELTLERKLDGLVLKIGMDQDRMVKASLSFGN